MSSGSVTLHPVKSGEAASFIACPEQAKRVEWETSLTICERSEDPADNDERSLDSARDDKKT